jgi:hypothetical protein
MKILTLSVITSFIILFGLYLHFESQSKEYCATVIIKDSNYQSDTIICKYKERLYIENHNLIDTHHNIKYKNMFNFRILNKKLINNGK